MLRLSTRPSLTRRRSSRSGTRVRLAGAPCGSIDDRRRDRTAGVPWLPFSCPACQQIGSLDLRSLDRPQAPRSSSLIPVGLVSMVLRVGPGQGRDRVALDPFRAPAVCSPRRSAHPVHLENRADTPGLGAASGAVPHAATTSGRRTRRQPMPDWRLAAVTKKVGLPAPQPTTRKPSALSGGLLCFPIRVGFVL